MTERAHHEYQHGRWTAVAGEGFLALVEPDAARRVVDGLWQVASGDGDVLGALGVVAADGFAALPGFAVVRTDADGAVHAVLRGPLRLRLHGADGVQEVAAGEGAVWTEHRALGVAGLEVAVDDAAGSGTDWWPLVGGVVQAAGLRSGTLDDPAQEVVDAVGTATHEQPVVPAPALAPVTAAVPHTPVVPPVVPVAEARHAEPADVAPGDVAPAEHVEPEQVVPVAVEAEHVEPVVVEPEPVEPEPAVEVVAVEEPVAATDGPTGWSALDAWPVAPAVQEQPQEPEPEPAAEIPWWPLTAADPAPATALDAPLTAASVGAAPAGSLAAGHVALGSGRPDVLDTGTDDHDGMTILSSDLARLRDRLPAWSQDGASGPFPTPEAAPPAARLVLSTGLVVALDRAVLLGRAPQVARVTNRELPRLVTVPSPNQDISRTHAEVRLEGEHVVVTDLDSTNGVHVSRPGEGVRRLHPGEPSVVGTDEVVDLGDGVTFTVERTA